MRAIVLLTATLAFGLVGCSSATKSDDTAGYRPLFDGKSLNGFHAFKKTGAPTNWKVEDGVIAYLGKGGDLVTDEQFGDFDLVFDWKISPGGNSGVIYRSSEQYAMPWHTGPEYQILDNAAHKDGSSPKTSAAANYALMPPTQNVGKPAGQWNTGRIVAKGNHIVHYLNGVKVVEYHVGSDEWTKLVAESKFAKFPTYGKEAKGHIVFQDHGNPVWFRNIMIRTP